MIQSNYQYLIRCKRPNPNRIAYLENTIKGLRNYHARARISKQPIIMRLILGYEILLDKLQARMENI